MWIAILRICCLLPIAVFLMAGGQTAFGENETEELTLLLPKGDAVRGRVDFQDLMCTACHRITGDSRLPKPFAVAKAPDLGPQQAKMSGKELATAIVMPSHKIPENVQIGIYGKVSPMTDYSDAITLRQLSNILAFLRSLK